MTKIDTDAFLRDLYELREIGKFRTGVHRPTYSPQDMESRHWLIERMKACGLEASIDGIGNVFGRHPGNGPHLLVGSHIETQYEAGWLDGALGRPFRGRLPGQPLSRRGTDRGRNRPQPQPHRRHQAARRAGSGGAGRQEAGDARSWPVQRLLRDAYRAGHAA